MAWVKVSSFYKQAKVGAVCQVTKIGPNGRNTMHDMTFHGMALQLHGIWIHTPRDTAMIASKILIEVLQT